MSLSSVDDGAESDQLIQFMSVSGTPTANDEATFWGGELGHDYLDILVAYLCDCYEQTLVCLYGLGSLLYALGIVQNGVCYSGTPLYSLLYASVRLIRTDLA